MNEYEEKQLKARNIRPTAMRILVLQYLTKLQKATSLLDLENHFELSDRSTLFRTIKTFEKNGLAHKIDDGSGTIKYALCVETCECSVADQHYHFSCDQCRAIYCLPEIKIANINLPKNFKMRQANLVLKGICANCN